MISYNNISRPPKPPATLHDPLPKSWRSRTPKPPELTPLMTSLFYRLAINVACTFIAVSPFASVLSDFSVLSIILFCCFSVKEISQIGHVERVEVSTQKISHLFQKPLDWRSSRREVQRKTYSDSVRRPKKGNRRRH